ncbi:MAG: hypothetical protein QOJ02_1024 [Acidobacteriota bacterium]|jgi:glycosyltransferase involved in cell wall biosynthesis|nr:hypothetical protein [Acidobacteriota bacterium]
MSLKDKSVLFVSYNGMLDPLGQSQVIPYLRELSKREGVRFTLLSFERAAAWEPEGLARCQRLRQELAEHNIEWHWLRYHQKPSLPATLYDVIAGVWRAQALVRHNEVEMVHARCGIPTTIALPLNKLFGVKLIADVRGLVADEYAESGHWRTKSIAYRLFKMLERRALAASNGVVTLTEAIWPILKEWDVLRGRNVPHEVVPCCADLEKFRVDLSSRLGRRAELNVQDKFLVVYSGSIGSWYLTDQMADLFKTLLEMRPDAHFLWLTPGDHNSIKALMRERGVTTTQYTVRSVQSAEVPSYLSASDVGIAFYRPGFSKLATSPVKVAEYLACGLPVIINAGIGDSDALVTREGVGALVSNFATEEYTNAVKTVIGLLHDVEAVRRRSRGVSEKLFDVRGVGLERYARLYEQVCQ